MSSRAQQYPRMRTLFDGSSQSSYRFLRYCMIPFDYTVNTKNIPRERLSDYRFVGAQLALDNTRDSIYCFKDSRLAAYLLTAYLAWIVVYESSLDSSSTMPT